MATTVTFTYSATTITLPAPTHATEPARYPQILGMTWGGGMKIADLGDGTSHAEIAITWDGLAETEYGYLQSFLGTTVLWSSLAFTYVDHKGVSRTNMHYVSGWEQFDQVDYDNWTGTIVIRKDMSP